MFAAKHIARLQRRIDTLEARMKATPHQNFDDERGELNALRFAVTYIRETGNGQQRISHG